MRKHYTIHMLYVLLTVLTASSYVIGDITNKSVIAMLCVMISAALKGGMIIRDFMGLNGVSFLWRIIMYGWLATVCCSITLAYFMSI